MIALLGQADAPTDALEDYCNWLARALELQGQPMEIVRMPWSNRGWIRGLVWLSREARGWRGRWVFVQYTALAWSRRAFPFGLLAVLCVLRFRGAKSATVFHDASAYEGLRMVDRVRRSLQIWIMRRAYYWSQCSILTVPIANISWLPSSHEKAIFIPVGANLSGEYGSERSATLNPESQRTIAVFSITGGAHVRPESELIAHVVRQAAAKFPAVRLLVLGRNGEEAAGVLRSALAGSNVDLEVYGVLSSDEIERRLSRADVLLFVRGGISSRRGSALAGIACGLAVVAYTGAETGPPVTEAGVILVKEGDRDALAEALGRVLSDNVLRSELHRRSMVARDKYFSWDVIARSFLQVMRSA
jgi:glycosyltransferase involved in cell wall biosynthesis